MNNFYTLRALSGELSYKISGKNISEVWSQRKDQIDIYFDPPETGKLTFSASSPGTALFLDQRVDKPSVNAASFFHEISGKTASGLELVSQHDRLLRLDFEDDPHQLLFMPFSSRPNLFLVRAETIVSAFKDHARWTGKAAPKSRIPDEVQQNTAESPEKRPPLKNRIIAIDKRFPRGLIRDLADTCNLDTYDDDRLKEKIAELQNYLLHPETASITAEGYLSLLPPSFLSHPPERTFDSVNTAVRTLFLMRDRNYRLLPRKNDLVKKLEKRLRGLKKQQEQFAREPERLQKADTLEHYGHLLMSMPDAAEPVSTDTVAAADWSDEDREISVPVTKGETLIAQAQKYYDKAGRIRREVAMSGKKKQQIAGQKEEIEQKLTELKDIAHPPDLEKWLKKHQSRLQQLGLAPSGRQPEARPYRQIPLGDYEVWIGKSAKSNDQMLSLSHKEDIWMHVRGASGSHVILRNKGEKDWPDKSLIRRAASFAAAYSRQSGSSLVPVMVTKRKHVRKPKGAAPGEVTVAHEQVELVSPQKPEAANS